MSKIKFAVMADIHLDIAKDGEKRLEAFLRRASEENVDFVIHLGDFAYPNDTSKTKCPIAKMPINIKNAYLSPSPIDKEAVLRRYIEYDKPAYHTMGNHDFDFLTPDEAFSMYGISSGYYSFHMKGWHFIVLDANYFRSKNGSYVHYDCGQYFAENDLPYLPTSELKWLENELKNGSEPVIIFSHQALFDYDGGIKNHKAFAKILSNARKNGRKIRICLSGHLHIDRLDIVEKTYYYNVTSLFGMWVGEKYQHKRYSDATEEAFPNLRYNIPYAKPVFSIIEMDEHGFSVQGMNGRTVSPSGKTLGWKGKCSPSVKARNKRWLD